MVPQLLVLLAIACSFRYQIFVLIAVVVRLLADLIDSHSEPSPSMGPHLAV